MTGCDMGGAASRPIDAATSGQEQPLAAVDVSQLVAVTLRLAMEVGALRERVRTHEALLVQHGVLPAGAVESFAPSADEVQSRLLEHRTLIEALARDLQRR
jgi:hypothetical protein